ncbi:hypothetical protein, conserved [Eimeria brunetti]|uniref:Uncharacterized protein n=1 Tax=Eimeria brunetti TaxID=51314 RepID=U6LRJ3_9EIME|nr:hypothetical protein, conserved [Eimeria brunetti]
MVRIPPDCPICCEPLSADLVATPKCGHIYHQKGPCRPSEVVALQFELTQPAAASTGAEAPEGESETAVLQSRLLMAKKNVNAIMKATVERTVEFLELKDRVVSLQREANSHLLRAYQAEAQVSDFRSRLVRVRACRDRLAVELQQIKKEIVLQDTRKHYVAGASTMSDARALEFLTENSGGDMSSALRVQHSVIRELQSENARLKSHQTEQIRRFQAVIQQRDCVIKRLSTAAATPPSPS